MKTTMCVCNLSWLECNLNLTTCYLSIESLLPHLQLLKLSLIPASPTKVCKLLGSLKGLDGPNRQSTMFSEHGQLMQAIPQFHVECMLHT